MPKRRRRRTDRPSYYPEPGRQVEEELGGNTVKAVTAKLSTEDVQSLVEEEGLGFCLWHLIDPSKVKDPNLRVLWRRARQAIGRVLEHIEEQT